MRSRSTGQGTGIATSKSSTDVPPSYWSHYWYAPQLVCGTMASFQKVQELCLRKKGASCGAAVPQGSKTIIRTHSSHPHIEHLTLDQLPGICGLSAHDREHSKPPRSEPLRRGCFQPGTPLGRLRRSGRSQKQKPRQPFGAFWRHRSAQPLRLGPMKRDSQVVVVLEYGKVSKARSTCTVPNEFAFLRPAGPRGPRGPRNSKRYWLRRVSFAAAKLRLHLPRCRC